MSLTVQQLLSDAKRLTGRLRDHDSSADTIITAAQDVLKEVEAMRQYQEDIESLNNIAHNRPRAQLVLGTELDFFRNCVSSVLPMMKRDNETSQYSEMF